MNQIFCVPDVNNKKNLNPILYFIASFPKYAFNIGFKIILKTIIMGTSIQFHDDAQLIILPTVSSEILFLNWAQKKPL